MGGRGRLFLLLGLLAVAAAVYLNLPTILEFFSEPKALPVVTEPSPALTTVPTVAAEAASVPPTETAAGAVPSLQSITLEANADNGFVVLCYHRFVAHPERFKTALSEYRFPQAEFRWQMQYLKDHGIVPISLQQLKDYWFKGQPLPPRAVLLTFDDGFRSLYDVMFPVLQQFKYPAVLFLYTDFIKGQGDSLSFEDIQAMEKYGLSLESHTKSHLNLGYVEEKKKPEDFAKLLTEELSVPVSFIEDKFSYTPTTLAYPYGVYNDVIEAETRKQNYQLAFTVNAGPNDRTVPPLKLKRDLILNPCSHEAFAALFEPKVLHLDQVQPADGQFILSHQPLISMVIKDPIDYKTLKLTVGTKPTTYHYDPNTHVLSHQMKVPLKSGGHFLTVEATDLNGQPRVYTWYFRIKHKGLLFPSLSKTLSGTDDK